MDIIYESVRNYRGRLARRMASMIEVGLKKPKSEWVGLIGEENVEIAIDAGILYNTGLRAHDGKFNFTEAHTPKPKPVPDKEIVEDIEPEWSDEEALTLLENKNLVPVTDTMEEDEFILFKGLRGYVLYHMTENKLWRTQSEEREDLAIENSELVDGVDPSDIHMKVVMQGKGMGDDLDNEPISKAIRLEEKAQPLKEG